MEIVVGVVRFKNKFLILKRGENKKYDPGKWEFVSGFIKGSDSLEKQAAKQVIFETEIKPALERAGDVFEIVDEYGKWIIHPFLFSSKSEKISFRKEDHTKYKWVSRDDLSKFNCVKDLDKNLDALDL